MIDTQDKTTGPQTSLGKIVCTGEITMIERIATLLNEDTFINEVMMHGWPVGGRG